MLKFIELVNIIIGLLLTVGSWLIFKDVTISLSLLIGSVIGGANFWALFIIVKGLMGQKGAGARLAALAFLKFLALIFVLWFLIKIAPVNVLALLAGLSTVIVSILAGYGLKGYKAE